MSTSKYHGEQGDHHGGQLHWPGYNGIPYRGQNPPFIKQEELDENIELHTDFKCQTFRMDNPEDVKKYGEIKDRIVNLWYVEIFCERWRDKDDVRHVYMEWSQPYCSVAPVAAFRTGASSIPMVG